LPRKKPTINITALVLFLAETTRISQSKTLQLRTMMKSRYPAMNSYLAIPVEVPKTMNAKRHLQKNEFRNSSNR
jgi:hypothetical protein